MDRVSWRPAVVDRLRTSFREDLSDQCWPWQGELIEQGYGIFRWRVDWIQRATVAHRAVYTLLRGDIPDDLTLDHLCRNRACVNPSHMEPVTRAENIRRGHSPSAIRSRAGTCSRGHPFEVREGSASHAHVCRQCARDRAKRTHSRLQRSRLQVFE